MSKAGRITKIAMFSVCAAPFVGHALLFTHPFASITYPFLALLCLGFLYAVIEDNHAKMVLVPLAAIALYLVASFGSLIIPRTVPAYIFLMSREDKLITLVEDITRYVESKNTPADTYGADTDDPPDYDETSTKPLIRYNDLYDRCHELNIHDYEVVDKTVLLIVGGWIDFKFGVAYSKSKDDSFTITVSDKYWYSLRRVKGDWFFFIDDHR